MAALRAVLLVAAIASLVACGSDVGDQVVAERSAPPSRAATLVVGSISDDPAKEAAKFQPFADALAARLQGRGITHGRVVVAPSVRAMTHLVRRGEVDIYIDSPFPALSVSEGSGAVPFLRRWKEGVAEYRSVIFVRKDSRIRSSPTSSAPASHSTMTSRAPATSCPRPS